jgi:hypothetical protein
MMGTGMIARAALMGAAVVLGSSMLAPNARADMLVFDLTQSNLGAGFTGPFIQVTVNRTSTTTATLTFDSLTNGGNLYLMHTNGAAAANINAATFTVGSIVATGPFNAPSGASGGSRTEDGFGTFNASINLTDGFQTGASEITFTVTNTSATWASAANVLTPNASGNSLAAQIGACATPCTDFNTITTTGFASVDKPVPGPIVGAGLPGLVMACGGLLALARRRRQKFA